MVSSMIEAYVCGCGKGGGESADLSRLFCLS